MNNHVANLLTKLPESMSEELVNVLVESSCIRIEHIVSTGQSSQADFWYDQKENEWVAVIRGRARLRFEGDAEPFDLYPGDHVLIPAHRKHRVEWTTPDEPTVWLAVFYSADGKQF